jgi:uncharacterized protein YdhG (YjbR/CyaY superfamily)
MASKPASLDEYLATLAAAQRATIEQLRETILSAVPDAEPVFSYAMPGFKLDGAPLAWVAAWKRHYSLYPLSRAMVAAHGDALAGYEMSKGTLKFPADAPLPYALVRRLVATRAEELRAQRAPR